MLVYCSVSISMSQVRNARLTCTLATLPPSAHLPILLDILSKNPTLSASILPQIPLPDLGDCVKVLEKCMSRVHRSAGDSHEGLDPARRWGKAKKDGEAFCGMVSHRIIFSIE